MNSVNHGRRGMGLNVCRMGYEEDTGEWAATAVLSPCFVKNLYNLGVDVARCRDCGWYKSGIGNVPCRGKYTCFQNELIFPDRIPSIFCDTRHCAKCGTVFLNCNNDEILYCSSECERTASRRSQKHVNAPEEDEKEAEEEESCCVNCERSIKKSEALEFPIHFPGRKPNHGSDFPHYTETMTFCSKQCWTETKDKAASDVPKPDPRKTPGAERTRSSVQEGWTQDSTPVSERAMSLGRWVDVAKAMPAKKKQRHRGGRNRNGSDNGNETVPASEKM